MEEELQNIIERHEELEGRRKSILQETEKFNYETKKHLVESGNVHALTINWSMIKRQARR